MNLEENELGHMSCRLDEAVTFIYIIRGNMICQINQEKEELKQGEGMFINSRNAYRFMSGNGNGCELYLTAVEEAYLNADDVTAGKYVNPIVNEEEIFGLKLNYESGEKKEALSLIRNIGEISKMKDIGYELELRSLVFGLWLNLYRELQNNVRKIKKAELRDKIKLYRMLEYLHAHYTEKITLSEMAENSDVSTGEYCRFFKKEWSRHRLSTFRHTV